MRGDRDRSVGWLGLRLCLVLTGVWRVVRLEGGRGPHYAGHWHRLHGTVAVEAGQAVVLQVEGDVVDVGHQPVRGEVQEGRDVLRGWRTDWSWAAAVERVVGGLAPLAGGLGLEVSWPALHFLAGQAGLLAAGLPGGGGQEGEVEADGVGVWVAVESAGDVVTVRLSVAASIGETSMALEMKRLIPHVSLLTPGSYLEVCEVDDVDFE